MKTTAALRSECFRVQLEDELRQFVTDHMVRLHLRVLFEEPHQFAIVGLAIAWFAVRTKSQATRARYQQRILIHSRMAHFKLNMHCVASDAMSQRRAARLDEWTHFATRKLIIAHVAPPNQTDIFIPIVQSNLHGQQQIEYEVLVHIQLRSIIRDATKHLSTTKAYAKRCDI
jgi:hypothetical protein